MLTSIPLACFNAAPASRMPRATISFNDIADANIMSIEIGEGGLVERYRRRRWLWTGVWRRGEVRAGALRGVRG